MHKPGRAYELELCNGLDTTEKISAEFSLATKK